MSQLSISAVFDGKEIKPLEPIPFASPYLVRVIFLEPAGEDLGQAEAHRRFWESFGSWVDPRPTTDILQEIHTGISKTEPPLL